MENLIHSYYILQCNHSIKIALKLFCFNIYINVLIINNYNKKYTYFIEHVYWINIGLVVFEKQTDTVLSQ